MKFIFKVLILSCFFSELSALNVRVLLRENQEEPWHISSLKGVQLRDAGNKDRVFPKTSTVHALTIQKEDQYIRVNGKKISSKLMWIDPLDKYLTIDGKTYDGRFLIAYEKNKWLLINVIDSEEYLYSVLKTESWPGWPLEVNKGFAIACRSYLLYQLLSSRDRDSVYHIKNTNYHQTYQGIHDDKDLRQAVEETRGIFLAYNQKPILAMFDCCCGGVITAKIVNGMDFTKVPYLARKQACTFCKGTKLYEWRATYSVEQFTSIVQGSRDHVVHPIRGITIADKDKAGLVKKVTIKTKRDFFTITARQMNLLFKGVKSYCFSVLKRGNTITIDGKGHGHHLGMCQWGAREMVRQGWSHKDILQFYYPDTYFMQLAPNNHQEVV